MPGPVALDRRRRIPSRHGRVRRRAAGGERPVASARRDRADRLVSRTARRSSRAGRRWASPISGRSVPRSNRSSSATGRPPTIPRQRRRSARRTSSTCRAASRAYLMGALAGTRRRAGDRGGPRARRDPGRLFGRGDGPGRAGLRLSPQARPVAVALATRPRVRAGRLGRAALRRLARSAVSAHRPPGAAWVGRARDRRGHGRHRAATAGGRSTGARGSRSGAAATATAIGPATRSGCEGRFPDRHVGPGAGSGPRRIDLVVCESTNLSKAGVDRSSRRFVARQSRSRPVPPRNAPARPFRCSAVTIRAGTAPERPRGPVLLPASHRGGTATATQSGFTVRKQSEQ